MWFAAPRDNPIGLSRAKHVLSLSKGRKGRKERVLSFRTRREIFPRSLAFGRLCENTVHGSTGLTTNGRQITKFSYLSVRPELCRRAPKSFCFSHSQSLGMTGFAVTWRLCALAA